MNKSKQNLTPFFKNGLLFALAALLIYSLLKNFLDYRKKIRFWENNTKDLRQEQEKNKKLKSEIVKVQDYYAVEQNIREKLNLLKPDEIALIIPRPAPSPTPTPSPAYSIPDQWRRLFLEND